MTLKEAETILMEAGVPDAKYDALVIAEHTTGKSRAALMADRFSDIVNAAFSQAIRRRAGREPLQYIIGTWGFMDVQLDVSPDCLIPRADTELLASLAAYRMKNGGSMLDLCTGSGCVAIAVLKACENASCVAVDLSNEAAAVCEKNAAKNGVSDRITVICGDVKKSAGGGRLYNVITANPPYIREDEMASLEPELAFEPRMALTDGGDGLFLIRAIIENYRAFLSPGGVIFIEIGSSQAKETAKIAEANCCLCVIHRDLAGRDRVAEITLG